MRLMPVLVALLPLLPLPALAASPAVTETLRVDRYADDGQPGSLRWAIETNNQNPGHYRIEIAAVGQAPYVIRPTRALPEIKGPVRITGQAWPAKRERQKALRDAAEVMRRLPHRYPFLLVDKAEDFVPATSIVGIKNVTHNEPFFPGHFPIDPVMPGVLIVEAMAQTGALLMSKTLDVAVADKVIMFMSIDGVRFRKPARPGDQLRMEVKVIRARGDAYKFRGETFIDGKLAG